MSVTVALVLRLVVRGSGSCLDERPLVNESNISISSAMEGHSTVTREVSRNIMGVKDAAEDTGKNASNVLSEARILAQQASELERRVDHFLDSVKAM